MEIRKYQIELEALILPQFCLKKNINERGGSCVKTATQHHGSD